MTDTVAMAVRGIKGGDCGTCPPRHRSTICRAGGWLLARAFRAGLAALSRIMPVCAGLGVLHAQDFNLRGAAAPVDDHQRSLSPV